MWDILGVIIVVLCGLGILFVGIPGTNNRDRYDRKK